MKEKRCSGLSHLVRHIVGYGVPQIFLERCYAMQPAFMVPVGRSGQMQMLAVEPPHKGQRFLCLTRVSRELKGDVVECGNQN